jgi:Immunity protein 35
MNFSEARKIAECWVSTVADDQAILDRANTFALPYGWVFFYNSAEYLADRSKLEHALVGNVPILLNRTNSELRVLGPQYESRLQEIESELPQACMRMTPEKPSW